MTTALLTELPRSERRIPPAFDTLKELLSRVWEFWDEYGKNRERVGELIQRVGMANFLDAGMVRVNAPTSGVDFHAPFGGAKESSYGPREQGMAARDFYTESRTVLIMP